MLLSPHFYRHMLWFSPVARTLIGTCCGHSTQFSEHRPQCIAFDSHSHTSLACSNHLHAAINVSIDLCSSLSGGKSCLMQFIFASFISFGPQK